MVESVNFEFLREKHPELSDLGGFAEKYAWTDPLGSLTKMRLFAERMVKLIYQTSGFHRGSYDTFVDLLNNDEFKHATPRVVLEKLGALRKYGNKAAHGDSQGIAAPTSNWMLKETYSLAQWFFITFAGGGLSATGSFVEMAKPASEEDVKAERNRLRDLLKEQEEQMDFLLERLETVRAEAEAAEKSKEEMTQLLAAGQRSADALQFNEEETRKQIIDITLLEAGWDVGEDGQDTLEVKQEVEVKNQPTETGTGYADYVLYDDNGLPLAVIEAKKTAVDPSRGKTQAKLYADDLERQTNQRPVIFYTNGFDLWIWDDAKGEVPRKLYAYYSKDSLRYCIQKIRDRQKLAELGPKSEIIDRMYQIEAVTRVTEKFETLKRRKALIVLATGTGKTRVAMAICELLFRAGWAQRVLFLCDRRELRKQARDAFSEFLPHEPRVYVSRRTRDDHNQRIYLSTYPAMTEAYNNFDPGFFDIIIADESHRSIYNKYREMFLYFDAYQIGLTATPVHMISRNTYGMFECEDQDPTSYFSYDDAINHTPPYLVPYRVIKHQTGFLEKGIKYSEMTPEQRAELEEQLEDAAKDVEFASNQVDTAVYNRDTEARVLRMFMERGIRNADASTIGKTILFARNHNHAIYLRNLFYELFPQYGGEFCEVIDNKEPRREALIDSFKHENKLMVAISVDMLDTGIDIPAVVNLVFHKPVKSYVKFQQMIGRGTRLCKNLFGEEKDKQEFLIFDHWGNFDYFGENPDEKEASVSKSIFQQIFEARIALAASALQKQDAVSFDQAIGLIEQDIKALPEKTIFVKEKRREVETVNDPDRLKRFSPALRHSLQNEIAPLMQWRKPMAKDAAYKLDLLMTRASVARLVGSADYDDLRDTVVEWVARLPINLNQVRDKLPAVNLCKSNGFWMEATVQTLEEMRETLRGIMHLATSINPGLPPIIIDVTDQSGTVRETGVAQQTNELRAYQIRVEQVLKEILDESSALQKIRSGRPVSEEEIAELADQVALRDPTLDLERLLESCNADKLEEALLQIVGLSAVDVNDRFSRFVQEHPDLTSNQLQFLNMMKSFIANHGALRIEQLYQAPFASLSGGLDGAFPEKLKKELVSIVKEINQL
jgi:type I restriction enzyme R subunit